MPVVISFTVETDGVLPDGSSFGDAIAGVDTIPTRTLPTTASTAPTRAISSVSWMRVRNGPAGSR